MGILGIIWSHKNYKIIDFWQKNVPLPVLGMIRPSLEIPKQSLLPAFKCLLKPNFMLLIRKSLREDKACFILIIIYWLCLLCNIFEDILFKGLFHETWINCWLHTVTNLKALVTQLLSNYLLVVPVFNTKIYLWAQVRARMIPGPCSKKE